MAYAVRADIEAIFGPDNVAAWADKNNQGNATEITTAITAALTLAEEFINNRLRNGPYAFPIDTDYYVVPDEVKDATARRAGLLLYDGRALTDQAELDAQPMAVHIKRVNGFINRVLRHSVKLDLPMQSKPYPRPINYS